MLIYILGCLPFGLFTGLAIGAITKQSPTASLSERFAAAGMKLIATWTKEDRGLGIGLLVGSLTVGSASPHLVNALPFLGGSGGMPPWRNVLLAAAAAALVAAAIALKNNPGSIR